MSVRRHRAIVATLVAACLTPALTLPSAGVADAASCRATPALLSRAPTSAFTLPGGAGVRIWDTGNLANDLDEVRIVVARVPKGSLTPRVLTAPSIDTARTPGSLAAGIRNAVVVVNGGVFDPAKGAVPVKSQVAQGVVRKGNSAEDNGIAIWGASRTLDAVHSHLAGTVRSGSATWPMTAMNWQSVPSGGIGVYTSAWGRSSHPAGTIAVVVSGGKVIAKRTGTAAHIPATGAQTILTALSGAYATALSRLSLGATVSISYRQVGTVSYDLYPHASFSTPNGLIYGGGAVVKYGVNSVTVCTTRGEQLRPRTVIGWLPNGDVLVVAISGRALVNGTRFGGASDHQSGDYLRQLGAVSAIKLDGGTSTTMLIRRTIGGPLVRVDRSGSDFQRPMPDALAFLA